MSILEKTVRTRFAPSPTGYLHTGGARTALFNWLFARKHGGEFLLRVEDTDVERNTEEARAAIFGGLEWLGMDFDGEPVYQSQRQSIYEKWFDKLVSADRVYEDGGAWKFRFERRAVTVHDLVCGDVTIDYNDQAVNPKTGKANNPDMVVRRSDGTFVFHFVNVVDDIEMRITHVIRGEDHLMNTPKHLQLFEAFGVEAPKFAHIPLILNKDGSKMSKRDVGARVDGYKDDGFISDAVNNYIALLGWSPKDDEEIFALQELIEKFDLSSVNRSGAKYDSEKCAWVNQQHLMKLTGEEFALAAAPYVEAAGVAVNGEYGRIAASVQEKVNLLTKVSQMISFYTDADYPFDSDAMSKLRNNDQAAVLLEKLAESFSSLSDWSEAKNCIGATAKENGVKPGQLMFPTRVALSGMSGGPDLGEILNILGKEESVRRVKRAVKELS